MKYPYKRPDLINDKKVPIVITLVVDVSKTGKPRLLILRRGDKVAYYKGAWAMPAGVIDNQSFRMSGPRDEAALIQSRAELAGELFLFPEDVFGEKVFCRYTHKGENGKKWNTFLVVTLTRNPEKVYCNWEHKGYRWIPLQKLLVDMEGVIPQPQTPNLLPDLKRLRPYLESLLTVV